MHEHDALACCLAWASSRHLRGVGSGRIRGGHSETMVSPCESLFDLDNTLFDRTALFRLWAEEFVRDRQLTSEAIEWLVIADEDGFADRARLWTEAKAQFGLSDPVETLVSAYYAQYLGLLEPVSEVQSCLADLRAADWRMCVITNGPQSHQFTKAERLGLLPFIDGFCSSGELGIAKPDRRIFDEALQRAAGRRTVREPLQEVWMIGDSPMADMIGAHRCGLRTVWIHRDRAWDPGFGRAPDLSAGSVREAVDHLLAPNRPTDSGGHSDRLGLT